MVLEERKAELYVLNVSAKLPGTHSTRILTCLNMLIKTSFLESNATATRTNKNPQFCVFHTNNVKSNPFFKDHKRRLSPLVNGSTSCS